MGGRHAVTLPRVRSCMWGTPSLAAVSPSVPALLLMFTVPVWSTIAQNLLLCVSAPAAACFVRHHGTYQDAYAASINPETREAFWSAAAADIDWITPPDTVSYDLLWTHLHRTMRRDAQGCTVFPVPPTPPHMLAAATLPTRRVHINNMPLERHAYFTHSGTSPSAYEPRATSDTRASDTRASLLSLLSGDCESSPAVNRPCTRT